MKKYIIFFIIFICIGFYLYNLFKTNDNNSYSDYNISRINSNIISNEKINNSKNSENNDNTNKSKIKEFEISSFTTKIYSKYPERQNNLSIACSTLDNTIVKKGETFSFCNTLGKATKDKGYENANVFQNGKEVPALGGGKCQVSSTLYNAVLKVPELEVIERHPHSGKVYYVPVGKDAAVSYGTHDFKFKNNSTYSIKIKAANTKNNLTITLLKLE